MNRCMKIITPSNPFTNMVSMRTSEVPLQLELLNNRTEILSGYKSSDKYSYFSKIWYDDLVAPWHDIEMKLKPQGIN
jgi:hypothetical protein